MKRTIGHSRMFVAGIVLLGATLGMLGDVKLAATNQVHPRVHRTEQEQMARMDTDGGSAMAQGSSVVARGRSGETDPCIPVAPVSFAARVPVIC